ncbi:hypothetical protein ACFXG6_34070 [Streptomyces roseus]|uniref:hypothetical protein n=1 Tax=Streptomyces roseus TaxID=66430 RepID=UPI0036CE0506
MADADQVKIQTTLGAVALLFEEGEAALLTDGHTFAVRRGAEVVVPFLDGLLEQAVALQSAALGLTGGSGPVRPGDFIAGYAQAVAATGGGGANPNALFLAMMAVNQLRELGLRPESAAPGAPRSRPALRPDDGRGELVRTGVGARAGLVGGVRPLTGRGGPWCSRPGRGGGPPAGRC